MKNSNTEKFVILEKNIQDFNVEAQWLGRRLHNKNPYAKLLSYKG